MSALTYTIRISLLVPCCVLCLWTRSSAKSIEWVRSFGSPYGIADGVAADQLGNVFVAGYMADPMNLVITHGFVTKFNAAGDLQWSRQISASSYESAYDVAVDGFGNAYVSGLTDGNLGGPSAGDDDGWQTPGPSPTRPPQPSRHRPSQRRRSRRPQSASRG